MTASSHIRTYRTAECASFRSTKEKYGGLSNMAGGYPLRVNGIFIPSAEALYQACRFPHRPEVQQRIIDQKSPMTAKMVSKPFRDDTRPDWMQIRVRVMRWTLRVKLAMHWREFGDLLLKTGDMPIVEDSRRDSFWGALRKEGGLLVGMNVLGRLLMELREELKGPNREALRHVAPPPIEEFVLLQQPIADVGFGDQAGQVDPDSHARPGVLWEQTFEDTSTERDQDVNPDAVLTTASTPSPKEQAEPVENVRSMPRYPKRLIEVDLPIKRISAHARREKDMRLGHIPSLHIYPAARPPAACRAVICAALWPDPADELCPAAFREAAEREMRAFAKATTNNRELMEICDDESWRRYGAVAKSEKAIDAVTLRGLLLDYIADSTVWEASTHNIFLDTTRRLTQAAHEALGGAPGSKPLVVDPFAGGGAIPLEALRVGADAFASDLNPVAVLINKVVLEYIPKYGEKLADEVRKWCEWAQARAKEQLGDFYPSDPDGSVPIAYLWARTITCEGPGCGAEVPLMRSFWLARKSRKVALAIHPDAKRKRIEFSVVTNPKASDVPEGTVARGSATCPCCGYTTSAKAVRNQLSERNGGSSSARMFVVVTSRPGERGRDFRVVTSRDVAAYERAVGRLADVARNDGSDEYEMLVEPTPLGGGRGAGRAFSQRRYGMDRWEHIYNQRQLLALLTYARLCRNYVRDIPDKTYAEAVNACLALIVDRLADLNAALCVWQLNTPNTAHVFGRWALQLTWDYGEVNPLAGAGGSPESAVGRMARSIATLAGGRVEPGHIESASADQHPLPDDAAAAFVTDPPYYDAVPYSDLLDFFYIWLKRTLTGGLRQLIVDELGPKDDECIVDEVKGKDRQYYEAAMKRAMAEGRRVLAPSGVGVVVFAHKSTGGWEAQLQAMVDAGLTITGSWPIDTEMGSRLRAKASAALASSVHLVCRPRENPDGSLRDDEVGDWRDVLAELPKRMHAWLPRLAEEGVVGADAIFACLGPALEVFSRYSRVEKASGEQVLLRDYLEHVWAAVSKEALGMIFSGGDATGFEEDARLTAMWLWTLAAPTTGATAGSAEADDDDAADIEEEPTPGSTGKTAGYAMEYDAARKIAQGLGAHLEKLADVIEVKGDKARLLAVSERTKALFGKDQADAPKGGKRKKKDNQMQLDFVAELEEAETEAGGWGDKSVSKVGDTVLDRLHQTMILFAAGRSEAMRRFLVEEGIGRDQRFWRLAQALSALYPPGTDEKRWVDGVLARKKGLGF